MLGSTRRRCVLRRLCAVVCLLSTSGLAQSGGEPPVMFTDGSAAAQVFWFYFPSDRFQMAPANISPMAAGGAVGDFNRDGHQDLFVLGGGGFPDALFINNGDGTFTELSEAWGVDRSHMGVGAAVGDFDGDGWLDLYVTSFGPANVNPAVGKHILYRNNGGTGFTDVAAAAGVHQTSVATPDGLGAAFGDYDLDGDLDLYVCAWVGFSGGNRLFRNNGDGTFTDVSVQAVVDDVRIKGFSPVFADMDGDRYPELLIAADFGTSRYFRNNRDGTFTNITLASGTGLDANGMGQCVGDLNNNGLMDWYVTSVHSDQFGWSDVPGTGNMLYVNQGNHSFQESSNPSGVNDGGWGWGTVVVDIDHDGWLDIVETNGWPFHNAQGQLEWANERAKVFRNKQDGTFDEIAEASGFSHELQGRGLLNFDLDNDGDQDFVVFTTSGPAKVYRNMLIEQRGGSGTSNWLRVILETSNDPTAAPDGIGARIIATANGHSQHRLMHAGCNYLSQSELSAHFGLGAATAVESLLVIWPNGRVRELSDVGANQTLTVHTARYGDANADGVIDAKDITYIILRLGQAESQADVDGNGVVDVDDIAYTVLRLGA